MKKTRINLIALGASVILILGISATAVQAVTCMVSQGCTGVSSIPAFSIVTGGSTSTAPIQSISSGTSGMVMTSNGPGVLPTFQNPSPGSGTVTSFSFTPSQGITGSVANATTSANLTLALGALTGATSYNGLAITADTGTITAGTWQGTAVGTAFGGTGATAINGTLTNSGSVLGIDLTSANTWSGLQTFSGSLRTNSWSVCSYLFAQANGSVASSATTASLLFAGASSINARSYFTGTTSSTIVANGGYSNVIVGSSPITTASTGTHPLLANLVVNPMGTVTSGGSSVTSTATLYVNGAGSGGSSNYSVWVPSGATRLEGDLQLGKTVTAAGTNGAQTINKTSGSVNFAASATSVVVTNSLVTAGSVCMATVGTNDATMQNVQCVVSSGSFTLYAVTPPTAATRVNFLITN